MSERQARSPPEDHPHPPVRSRRAPGPENTVPPQGRSRCGFAHLARILERRYTPELRGSGDLTKFMTCLPWREFCSWPWTAEGKETPTYARCETDFVSTAMSGSMMLTRNGEKALRSTLSPRYQRSIMPPAPPSPGSTAGCEFSHP